MQNWLALFALVTLVSSPLIASEEAPVDAQPDLGPRLNNALIPPPPLAEAAEAQPENLTDRRDVDLQIKEGPVFLGDNGLPLENQPH